MAELGFDWTPTMTIGSGCKVHLKADELPKGRLICMLSRHAVAVIDGVINDTYDPSRDGTRCVYGYWKLGGWDMGRALGPRREWYIAIGNGHGWGRSKSASQAIRSMHRNSLRLDDGTSRSTRYSIYFCSEGTEVTGHGGLQWPKEEPEPVLVRTVDNGKVIANATKDQV